MKRIQYHGYGGPEKLRLEEVDRPTPAKGEVLVRIVAAAVNPMDWGIRQGNVRLLTGFRFPRGLGHDFAGVVEAVGEGVTKFKVGEEVLGAANLRQAGAFAEAIAIKETLVFHKPAELSWEQAAALTIPGATAYAALVTKGRIGSGQSVFISGCLGAVGRAGVQIALGRDARVIGSCSAAAREEALSMGIERAVDYRDFAPDTFRGCFDLVFDAAGSLSPSQCGVMLKRGGVALHVTKPFLNMARFLFSRRHKMVIAQQSREAMAELIAAAEQGRLRAAIGGNVPLSDAIPALIALEQRKEPKGKLLILPSGSVG